MAESLMASVPGWEIATFFSIPENYLEPDEVHGMAYLEAVRDATETAGMIASGSGSRPRPGGG